MGTGFGTERIKIKSRILIDPDGVRVRFHRYDGLPIGQVVDALLERPPTVDRPIPRPGGASIAARQSIDDQPAVHTSAATALRVADVLSVLIALGKSRYSFTANVGDWGYAAMASALGATAQRVTTPAELTTATDRAEVCSGAFLIEAVTARDDLSPVMAESAPM